MLNLPVHRPVAGNRWRRHSLRSGMLSTIALLVLVGVLHPSRFHGTALHPSAAIAAPSRSTTIALTSDKTRLVVVNREANSVSVIQVKDDQGNDVAVPRVS